MNSIEKNDLRIIWKTLWNQDLLKLWKPIKSFFDSTIDFRIIVNIQVCQEFLNHSSEYENYRKLAKILSQDAGLTADVLKIINSAYFGYSFAYSELERAVGLLGPKTIASVIIMREVNRLFNITKNNIRKLKGDDKKFFESVYNEIYYVSQAISRIAFSLYRYIHKIKNPKNIDFDVVTLGLFSTLPDLVALSYFVLSNKLNDYKEYYLEGKTNDFSLTKEQLCFGLLHLWKFPFIYEVCVSTGFSVSEFEKISNRILTIYNSNVFNSALEYIALIETCKIFLSDIVDSDLLLIDINIKTSLKNFTYVTSSYKALNITNLHKEDLPNLLKNRIINIF